MTVVKKYRPSQDLPTCICIEIIVTVSSNSYKCLSDTKNFLNFVMKLPLL